MEEEKGGREGRRGRGRRMDGGGARQRSGPRAAGRERASRAATDDGAARGVVKRDREGLRNAGGGRPLWTRVPRHRPRRPHIPHGTPDDRGGSHARRGNPGIRHPVPHAGGSRMYVCTRYVPRHVRKGLPSLRFVVSHGTFRLGIAVFWYYVTPEAISHFLSRGKTCASSFVDDRHARQSCRVQKHHGPKPLCPHEPMGPAYLHFLEVSCVSRPKPCTCFGAKRIRSVNCLTCVNFHFLQPTMDLNCCLVRELIVKNRRHYISCY